MVKHIPVKHSIGDTVPFTHKDGKKDSGKIYKINTETDKYGTTVTYDVEYLQFGNEMGVTIDAATLKQI